MSYQNPPPYTPPNSSMALISLIAGILGLTAFPVIGSIVAVITGSMAKKEIQQSNGAMGGIGMAQAGMILGWVGIGLLVLGLCVGGLFLIPACLALFGIAAHGSNWLAPVIFGSLIF
jgi:hypothetical protein